MDHSQEQQLGTNSIKDTEDKQHIAKLVPAFKKWIDRTPITERHAELLSGDCTKYEGYTVDTIANEDGETTTTEKWVGGSRVSEIYLDGSVRVTYHNNGVSLNAKNDSSNGTFSSKLVTSISNAQATGTGSFAKPLVSGGKRFFLQAEHRLSEDKTRMNLANTAPISQEIKASIGDDKTTWEESLRLQETLQVDTRGDAYNTVIIESRRNSRNQDEVIWIGQSNPDKQKTGFVLNAIPVLKVLQQ